MSAGSAKPKRRKATAAALHYEHRRGRPDGAETDRSDGSCGAACLSAVVMAALLVLPAVAAYAWGEKVWGGLAPAWPGGGYGFAATVGAMVPLALAALIAPLTRMDWRRSKARTLGWAAAALPGLVWGEAIAVVIAGVMRPKHRRDWDSACYAEGGTCWIHVRYPFIWAAGLVTTLTMSAILVVLIVKYVVKDDTADGESDDAPSPAAT